LRGLVFSFVDRLLQKNGAGGVFLTGMQVELVYRWGFSFSLFGTVEAVLRHMHVLGRRILS
jgi:hypothetical protein